MVGLGAELASAYQSLDQIDNEEAVIKAKIKERKADVQQQIGTLSRNISARFDMQNIECRWMYDFPNVGEVAYQRIDTSEIVKTRAMTAQERQQELPLEPVAVNPQKPEETAAAVEAFFEPDKFPAGQVVDAEWVDLQVDTPVDVVGEPYGEPIQAVADPEPIEARQTLLTMGDAKKGRKKKAPEPSPEIDF